jgi:hypothetical protein
MSGGVDSPSTVSGAAGNVSHPAVVRQKTARLTQGRVAITLVFDRDLSAEEMGRFYRQTASDRPAPLDYFIEGRLARYECEPEDEAKWRLAFEIYFVKAFREPNPEKPRDTGIRARAGLRKLHLG